MGACLQCGARLDTRQVSAPALTPAPDSAETSFEGLSVAIGDAPTGVPGMPVGLAASGLESEGPLTLGQTFGSRYHVIKMLGIGGMGAVYQVWDSQLEIALALKVIKPEVTADRQVAQEVESRFKRELLLARKVTHKNVLRIHDLGEVDGIKYITMSYVEGSDLASILREEGKLTVPRALRVMRAVVAGLQAAHDAGVVHRDLKPENIMIDADGEALIMDFGIARSITTAPEATGKTGTGIRPGSPVTSSNTNQTVAGTVVGTVEYMAPEQARAEPADQRSDGYALGLILYDMLVGRQRAAKGDPIVELMTRLSKPPVPARSINPAIPEAVDAIITRCVQIDPAARYQSTAELSADLARLDDNGEPIPIARRFTRLHLAIAAAAVVALLTGTWRLTRWMTPAAPAAARPSVSVLIADFENGTGDSVFEGSLEQALNVAMEGASFVNVYPRANAVAVAAQIKPGTTRLDEPAAKLVSNREQIKFVVAGRIDPNGSGYRIGLRAIDPIPGTTLAEASATARTKGDVLQAMGSAAAKIRVALGDAKSETEKLTADESFTAASLEASRDYAQAQTLASSGRDEEAIVYYKQAIARDAKLGRAYSGWALSADKLGRKEESLEQWQKAMALTERMSEREKYRTQATYFSRVMRNYGMAIENNLALVARYPADGIAHNNLAVAYFNVLNFAQALREGSKVVELYPKTVLYRYNYALYAMYAGDFATAEREAKQAIALNPETFKAYLALAMAALGRGDLKGAADAYERARADAGARGASLASIGLADLAMYQGRYADAAPLLTAGIAADEAAKNTAGAALKYAALAEAHLAQRKSAEALKAAQRAVALSRSDAVLVPAARVFAATGKEADARAIASELDGQLQKRSRAYGQLVTGEIALQRGRVPDAVDAFTASQKHADYTAEQGAKGYWLSRFDLGVAYVQAGHFAEALSEFEACLKRQSEATAVFMDDVPTYRYVVALPYWMARAQEGGGLKSAAIDNYRKFLTRRPVESGDPLAADARRRIGAD